MRPGHARDLGRIAATAPGLGGCGQHLGIEGRVHIAAGQHHAGDVGIVGRAMREQAGGQDVGAVAGRLVAHLRSRRDRENVGPEDPSERGVLGLMRAVQSESQRAALDRLLVLGTLLEGHADHVMDAVGPAVVPTVATIRNRFDARRQRKQPPLQRILRALLGIDAKLSQYTRGKAFVDDVVGRVGMDGFNRVWEGPATLPLPDEIDQPQRWIDRVL